MTLPFLLAVPIAIAFGLGLAAALVHGFGPAAVMAGLAAAVLWVFLALLLTLLVALGAKLLTRAKRIAREIFEDDWRIG